MNDKTVISEPNETLKFYCNRCSSATNHKIIIRIERKQFDTTPIAHKTYDYISEYYEAVQCQGCDHIVFRFLFSEDNDYEKIIDPSQDVIEEAKELDDDILELIPTDLQPICTEIRKSINSGFHMISAIALRTLIERVCHDKGITDDVAKNEENHQGLGTKVKILRKKHIINDDMKNILNKVIDMGNSSAHDGESHTRKNLDSAFKACLALIHEQYVSPEKIKRIMDEAKEILQYNRSK